MCGIIGYIGKQNATPILIEGLRREIYRGYDSAGVVVFENGKPVCIKEVGKLENLEKKLTNQYPEGNLGLGHCRWATTGEVNEKNAHPHWDCRQNIYLAHNGIVENYKELKEKLISEGHKFTSETDTEIIAHLIEKFFDGNLEEATRKALKFVRGTYGLAIIARDDPGKLVVARNSSPILIGIGEDEYIVASDAAAIVGRTKKVVYLNDGEIAVLTPSQFEIQDLNRNRIEKRIEEIDWNIEEAQKGGYPHFMLKEIFEAPEVVENALRGRLIFEDGLAKLGGLDNVVERLRQIDKLIICACGTSYFASLVGEYMLEEYAGIPVEVEYGSEFRYRKPVLDGKTGALGVSQSGETADTLASLREAKRKGVLTLGIINVVGSSLARETEVGIYNHAGPEIGVASTKTFISQLAILALLTLFLGRQRQMSQVTGQRIIRELKEIPQKINVILSQAPLIEKLAQKYKPRSESDSLLRGKDFNNFLFIGRKYNFPVALEGALKLKEISYIHAEGYGAGEMKHGPIALIDENFPTVAICPSDSVYEKMISNIEEIKVRKGPVIAIATEGNEDIKRIVDDVIYIPKALEMLTPILTVIPLQLFAYYMGVLRGCDVDKPRNLAKSVTVE